MARVEEKWQVLTMSKAIRSGGSHSALIALCAFLLALGSGAEMRVHCAAGPSSAGAVAGSAGGHAHVHAQAASEDPPASQDRSALHDRTVCAPAPCQALAWQQATGVEFARAGAVELPVRRLAGLTISPLARPPDLDA